ncbi:MAG: TolC family protein [Terriglobales bacterium]
MRVPCAVFGVYLCAQSVIVWGQTPMPLAKLQAEALAQNPSLAAARQRWRAAQAAIAPAGALPDPHAEVQQMNGGSPVPLAGYGDNMMSYVGVGAMQALPYPGKLKLRAAVAASNASALQQSWRQAQRQLREQVADAYIALQQARAVRGVLVRQQQVLAEAEKLAEVHYRTARGPQADVLAAQLEQTKMLRNLVRNQDLRQAAQARLRALVNRAPSAAAITPEPLRPTRLQAPEAQVVAALARGDPALAVQRARLTSAQQATALARKNFQPDFTAQFMWEHTAAAFPDRTMITLGMSLPFFHRHSRQEPELERAAALHAAAQADLQQLQLRDRDRLTEALLAVQSDGQILAIDQQGALPQARASAQAALTAYANGQGDLNSYLTAWREALALEQQYWQTLGAHEAALATVTALTGVEHD